MAARKPRTSPLVPTRDIDRWLGRVHVGTPDSAMVAMLIDLVDQAAARDPRWTRSIRLQTQRYALWRHHANQAEYAWVMGSH
jgi:hypothetical protein